MIHFSLGRRRVSAPPDLRRQMILETSLFLSWALERERGLPRIPRRRVDQGGFTALLREGGARAMLDRWWSRTLTRRLPY